MSALFVGSDSNRYILQGENKNLIALVLYSPFISTLDVSTTVNEKLEVRFKERKPQAENLN